MPDKSSSIVSYAAGASLAAVALIYVFGPTFAIDHDASSNSSKKTAVGLYNQANDCFINSVLQALAGLGDLRIYLIRETHRRRIQDPAVYANLVQPLGTAKIEQWKLQGLQDGLVTQGLKEMLDALNERPIYRKSVSPFPFVRVLEVAFKQRISRQQQDAQEFLQIVAERLKDEYHAGHRVRYYASKNGLDRASTNGTKACTEDDGGQQSRRGEGAHPASGKETSATGDDSGTPPPPPPPPPPPVDAQADADLVEVLADDMPLDTEEGFPLEGKYESHLECQTCNYKTKPREETFCTLTLAVPQVSSTSLNACFDGVFKTEYIDDFKCEMCRLLLAKSNLERDVAASSSEDFIAQARDSIRKLQAAIDTDPEQPPDGVDLGDIRHAPKRRIAKTTRISIFPKVLALHLSRSIYGVGQITQKNSAKVAFPEELPLGGLVDRHKYKLLGTVTHRGGHNSGHYEAFRRQNQPSSPYHNANTFQPSDVYSKTQTPPASTPEMAPSSSQTTSRAVSTPTPTPTPTPLLPVTDDGSTPAPPRCCVPAAEVHSDASSLSNSNNSKERDVDTSSLRSATASVKSVLSKLTSSRAAQQDLIKMPSRCSSSRVRRRKPAAERWWRISDEKVREAKTSDVLAMQREVYLLFYELER